MPFLTRGLATVFGRMARGRARGWRSVLALGFAFAACPAASVGAVKPGSVPTANFASGHLCPYGLERGLPENRCMYFQSFTARSGPHGESPTGSMTLGQPDQPYSYTGSITCLAVHGYTAVIGTVGIARSFTREGFVEEAASYVLVAVDNNDPPNNVFVPPRQPPANADLLHVVSLDHGPPPNCSTVPTIFSDTGSFGAGDIVVRDSQDRPPRITPHRNITITLSKRRRVRVVYRLSARDDFDRHPKVTCRPRSGSRFPVGTTWVHCTASDRSSLTARTAFRVRIKLRR